LEEQLGIKLEIWFINWDKNKISLHLSANFSVFQERNSESCLPPFISIGWVIAQLVFSVGWAFRKRSYLI
jgi:hypothetical protein